MDAVTAVSGSGPAYFFLFVEALIDAAVQLGLPPGMAKTMVVQTMLGSSRLIEQSGKEPSDLRKMVTSPGGTTAEALYYLEKAGFRTAISRAVWAAYLRSAALGQGKGRSQAPNLAGSFKPASRP